MPTKKESVKKERCECSCHHHFGHHARGGGAYGLGFIGAAVYFVSTASGFWMVVLGILKAMVWPAFAVYGLLRFLGV